MKRAKDGCVAPVKAGARRRRALLAAAIAVLVATHTWAAQPVARVIPPEAGEPERAPTVERTPDAAVARLLASGVLTDEQRQDTRIFHGVWQDSDLDSPARVARVALMVGAFDDPSLSMDGADLLDRADAAAQRGDCDAALALLGAADSARAGRIRAEALLALGRAAEAAQAAEAAARTVMAMKPTARTAQDITEMVRALTLRARIKGPEAAGGADFKAMMAMLGAVHDQVNRLDWPSRLAEAQLLYEKDNPQQAEQAVRETLALNPACAEAWALLGRMAEGSYDLSTAEQVAARLDALAGLTGSPGPSALGAMLRVRVNLKLNDPDTAADALEPVLQRFPKMRQALALKATIEAARYNFDRVKSLLTQFDALAPGSALAVLEVGKQLSDARQYDEAAAFLETAHKRHPAWAEPLINLGLLQVQAGRIDRAREALEKAVALDPFNLQADNSLRLVKELLTYQTVESEHYIVRFKPGVDGVLAREMFGPLEANHRIVCGNGPGGIEHEPSVKTYIDLMPDHRWFGVRIAGMPAIHTLAAATGSCIALEVPREGRDHLGTYDWVRVLRHEYTHTVTLSRTRNRIPHWFTEAAAVYLELSPRDYNTCQMLAAALQADRLFDLSQINLAFIRPKRPSDRAQAYAQGEWMYEYIIERWGRKAPLELMDLYAQGLREESAFQTVLGVSRDEFLGQFNQWAKQQVVSWGLAPRDGEPTIPQLLVQEAATDPAQHDAVTKRLDEAAEDTAWVASGVGGGPDDAPVELPEITLDMAKRWLDAHPDNPDVLELAATKQAAANPDGKPTPDMIPLLEHYAATRPVDPRPHSMLANLYLNTPEARPAEAIPHLEYLDAREQKSAAYAMELARLYAAAQDWEHATAKVERATQIAPYDATCRELAATIALQRKDYATAERHIAALVELEPDRPIHKQRLEAVRKMKGQGK